MAVVELSTRLPISSNPAPNPERAPREIPAALAMPESLWSKSAINPPVAAPVFASSTNALPSLVILSPVIFPSKTFRIFPSEVVI